jgi:hypothetical protein
MCHSATCEANRLCSGNSLINKLLVCIIGFSELQHLRLSKLNLHRLECLSRFFKLKMLTRRLQPGMAISIKFCKITWLFTAFTPTKT